MDTPIIAPEGDRPHYGSTLYLASRSPRRRALLDQIGIAHTPLPVVIDETPRAGEEATRFVMRLAVEKARAALDVLGIESIPHPTLLAADTAVVIDGEILGKPADRATGLAMLARLSGRSHRVLTGVALLAGGIEQTRLSVSQVRMRSITPTEAAAYWATGEPLDKAGAYAIQGLGALFVAAINGSYSGVMGLPLFETAELLRTAGIDLLNPNPSTAGSHDA